MSFVAKLQRAREVLEQQRRLSVRALGRELDLADQELHELIEELVDVQRVARREENVLVWSAASTPSTVVQASGSALAADRSDARKVVTIVFADLVGSTALHERLDPESARRFMESYYVAMRRAVESHGGTVTQFLGDGVKAVFGIPRVAEDDAIRAVRAAVEMQRAFRELAEQQRGAVGKTGLRVAVNTGEVVANDATEIIGDPVNVAARLQEQGRDGDVVVGESTYRLVGALVTLELLGSFALKGRSEAVKAYRVVSLDRPAGAATAPFVGRDEELARLAAVYDAAAAKPAAALAVLVGSPGLGKSRLIDEFARRHADAATVVQAHCDATGGSTFAPLAQALRELLGIDDGASAETLRTAIESALPAEDTDRARIAGGIAALASGSPASPEETFFVVRRMLGSLARRKPVVLVIDDLHWAEPLLFDLVEHLIQWGGGVPLFVLIGARPELRELRSSLVTPGGFVSDVVTLGGLDAGAAMRLAANVIGASDLPASAAAKVLATSEGNPLFVGELVRMLVQEGALTKEGERWTVGANLAALEMPPTIHALLAARIERLRPEERGVLERAAVVGRHFSRSAVAALLARGGSELDARLEALRRSELIERDTGWLLGEPVLRFHHVLIRDAAYRRLLKGTRAELHAKLADWIEAQVGDAAEHDETIGWHLEQAHQFLRELGPLDENAKRLGERAAARLSAAGRRALGRDDVSLAASLLGRAIEQLEAEDPARAALALDWCEALLSAGDVGPAAAAIAELGRFAGADDRTDRSDPSEPSAAQTSRLRAWHTCFTSQLTVLTAPQGLQAAADAVAEAARLLAARGDAAGEAKAHSVHAQALARLGKVGACEAALDQALAAARRAGDRRRANAVLAGAPLAALWGPSPVTRASGRCLDVVRVLRITQGAPAVESVALSCQGVLEALRGRTEAARRMLASARKMVEELGIAHRLFEADAFAGRIAAMEGDAAGGERLLRSAYEGLRELGLGIDAARAGALLARTLLAQDRVAEAESLSHESERLAGDDLQAAIAWRGVRAEALAKRGEHTAAVELAQAAVAIASATDALLDHADARMALAAALRAAGRGAAADAEERRAIELWEAKGATFLAERVHSNRERQAPIVPGAAPIAMPTVVRRRVRPNAATAMQNRFAAALAARDFDAIATQFREDHQEIDHPTGSAYGRDACIASLQRLFRSRDPHYEVEPLATLGQSLLLVRRRSGAAGTASARYDVGAYENEAIQLFEVDASGLCRSAEVFAVDHLGDAIARLYARHAELLPDGPERERAAATARSLGTMLRAARDLERVAAVIAPNFEAVDHRHLSTWSMRGGAAFVEHLRALLEVAADVVIGTSELLALELSALLIRRMHSGTERLGGGAYERPFLVLFATDAEGRLARAEWFDADREVEALTCFEALVANAEPKRPIRRRVRANAASAVVVSFEAAFAADDTAALKVLWSEALEVLDHPNGATYGRDGHLGSVRRLRRAYDPRLRFEPLATLGESLFLCRRHIAATGAGGRFDVGAYEREEIVRFEVDEHSCCRHIEVFGANRLGDAITRLYERYAELLPEGPERSRAAATAGSVAVVAPGGFDRARYAEVFRSDVEIVDHKPLGLGTGVGLQTLFRSMAAGSEVADQVVSQPQDVLALTHDALLLRWLASGVGRESGGAFEWAFLRLFIFDPDGRVARYELFDDDSEAEALARFDELVGRTPSVSPLGDGRIEEGFPSEPFANAASRSLERNARCWAARDWDGALAILSPVLRFDDRRRLMRIEINYEDFVAQFRLLFDQPASRWRETLIATRGERLALTRTNFEAEVTGGGGPLAFDEHLSLTEVDADGRWIACVTFDLQDLDAAYAELDARFEAGEGVSTAGIPSRFTAGVSRGDWAALTALCSPELVEHDHRPVIGLEPTRGAEAWVQNNLRVYIELAPDTVCRSFHVRACEGGWLVQFAWEGTREGGRYEISQLAVVEQDEGDRSRMLRVDVYDLAQLDLALARFAELAAQGQVAESLASFEEPATGGAQPAALFANAATRAVERGTAALAARDWEAFAALMAPELRHYDRTRVAQLETHGGEWLASFRQLVEMTAEQPEYELLATRGDRLALFSMLWRGAGGDVGPSEIDWRLIVEVNDREEHIAIVVYDSDRLDAAYAELDARWAAHGTAEHPRARRWLAGYLHAFAVRDWTAMTALFTPDLVGENHRLVGWGTRQGPEGVVSTLQAQIELAPDTQERVDHVRTCDGAVLFEYAWHGTRDGGAFENLWLVLVELAPDGRACRADVWEPEQLDQARARFAEIAARDTATAPFENVASHAWREVIAAWRQRDLERFAALQPSPLRYRDHRRLFQLDLDREGFLEFTRPLLTMRSASAALELLATRGERLALMRFTLEMEDDVVGPSAIDSLLLIETDEGGAIAAYDRYEVDDDEAARAEVQARWEVGEFAQFRNEAWNRDHSALVARRDWDAVAALYSPAVVGHDHRLVGWGTLRGRTDFLQSLRSMEALSPDARIRSDHVRVCPRGAFMSNTWVGTRDGGAFESPFLVVSELDADGKVVRIDFYDPHHLEWARARFKEISANPPADPIDAFLKDHAALTALESWRVFDTGADPDWEALHASCAPDMTFEDRQGFARLSGDREMMIASLRERVASGARAERRLLGTAGERIAVMRMLWTGGPADGRFEIEYVSLAQLDEAGLVVAIILFGPDDERAAQREAWARWAAIDPVAAPWVDLLAEITEAWNSRDRPRLRARFADDVVVEDHRHAGLGRIEGAEAYVGSNVVLWELAPDQRLEFGWSWPAVDRLGVVATLRREGTLADGGAFESEHVWLGLARGGRLTRMELFDIDALDTALARFAELCAAAAAEETA